MPIDPNLVYLILIVGLWLSVTAFHIPGTGIMEVLAAVGVISSLVILASMPVNWWALVLIVIGVLGFLIVPFVNRRFAPLASLGLILQAIGSLLLFNGLSVSVPLIAVTIIVALIYYFFALLPALEHQRKSAPALLEDQPIVGLEGRVQSTVDPVGTVYVRGETWTARSDHKLDVGTEVSVVDQEGLTLYVEAVKQKRRPEEG